MLCLLTLLGDCPRLIVLASMSISLRVHLKQAGMLGPQHLTYVLEAGWYARVGLNITADGTAAALVHAGLMHVHRLMEHSHDVGRGHAHEVNIILGKECGTVG